MTVTTHSSVGIVGAGVLGRLLALKLSSSGWKVTLFDRHRHLSSQISSFAATGMLAPYCALDTAEVSLFHLGKFSLELWPRILEEFGLRVFFQKQGSIVLAHPRDHSELVGFRRKVIAKVGEWGIGDVSERGLATLEPTLKGRFFSGIHFPSEGQIDNRELLIAMDQEISRRKIQWFRGQEVQKISPHCVQYANQTSKFDLVLDCRGIDAKEDLRDLRSIRSELIIVEAPDVQIQRPIRLMHPRYPLYVVPRPSGKYLLGATHLESEDRGPISVRSTLELLSAAFTLHPAFAEARVIETVVGLLPAFPDHLPRVFHQKGLIRVNGLYRYGYLLSPQLMNMITAFIATGSPGDDPDFIFIEEECHLPKQSLTILKNSSGSLKTSLSQETDHVDNSRKKI